MKKPECRNKKRENEGSEEVNECKKRKKRKKKEKKGAEKRNGIKRKNGRKRRRTTKCCSRKRNRPRVKIKHRKEWGRRRGSRGGTERMERCRLFHGHVRQYIKSLP